MNLLPWIKLIEPPKETTEKCMHDWETIKNTEAEEVLKKKYSKIRHYWSHVGLYSQYVAFYLYGNRFEIEGSHILSQKVCLTCGKCVNEEKIFMEKVATKIKTAKDRKKLANKIWEDCLNDN